MMKLLKVKIAAFFALALTTAGLLTAASYQAIKPQLPANPASAAPAAPDSAAAIPVPESPDGFGPMIALTIYHDSVANPDTIADLDTGKTTTMMALPPWGGPRTRPSGQIEWLANNGIDLNYEGGDRFLRGFDLAAVLRPSDEIEKINANQLLIYLMSAKPTETSLSARVPGATFAFRTREGSVGILQLVESVDPTDPRGTNGHVNLRYRLVTAATRDRVASRLATTTIFPEIAQIQDALAKPPSKTELLAAARMLVRSTASLEEIAKGTSFTAPARRAASAARYLLDAATLDNDAQTQKALADFQKTLSPALDEIRTIAAKLSSNQ